MLKKLWRKVFPEQPIRLGEALHVPQVADDGYVYTVAGLVTRLYGNGMADVYVFRAPNMPECHRMRVLTREEMQQCTASENIAWRV